jgi:hypothetical protein
MKTPEQKKIIEKKEYDKILRKREEVMIESLKRVRNAKKYTFINHLSKFIENKDITPTISEKEVED